MSARGAHSYHALGNETLENSRPPKDVVNENQNWWMFGNLPAPTVPEFILGSFVSFVAHLTIGLAVVLANMGSTTLDGILKGFLVGLLQAAPLVGFTHGVGFSSSSRPFIGTSYVWASAFAGHVGPVGVLYHCVLQGLAGLTAGGIANALMNGMVVGNTNNSIAIPLTTGGYAPASLASTVCLAIFMPALIYGPGFLYEHLMTPTAEEKSLRKNYRKGYRISTIMMLVVVTITFQFGSFMYGWSPYIAGLITGVNQAGNRNSAVIFNQNTIPNSVFANSSNGAAFGLYFAADIAAGILIGLFYLLVSYFFTIWSGRDQRIDIGMRKKRDLPSENAAPSSNEGSNDVARQVSMGSLIR